MSSPESYDTVPYPELSYMQTHPDRLATRALLHGLTPRPLAGCRVLEVGCAGGGNLLPMAYGMPDARFVGIDHSARQIEQARHHVASLGLGNVELIAGDIADMDRGQGPFDYIIAHGFYSWVEPHLRDKLLDICRTLLTPSGVAYVSYNTYPGWHITGVVRDAMMFRTRHLRSAPERAREARSIVGLLADTVPDAMEGYAGIFRSYREFMRSDYKGAHDGFLLHDELEAVNEPVYFHQFAGHAARFGLRYLTEAEPRGPLSRTFGEEALGCLRALSADAIELEQYVDFLCNTMFRQSLLVHRDAQAREQTGTQMLEGVFVCSDAAPLAPDADPASLDTARYRAGDGVTMATDHPLTKMALLMLAESHPGAIRFPDLVTSACWALDLPESHALEDSADATALARNLLDAHEQSARLVELHAFAPPKLETRVGDAPRASAVARMEALTRRVVTNLWHAPVELDPMTQALLGPLDGSHSRAELVACMREAHGAGRMPGVQDVSEAAVAKRIAQLAKAALLVEDTPL